MMKNRISVHGSYFFNNYGDILLVDLFSNWVKEYKPEVELNYPMLNRNEISGLSKGSTGLWNLLISDALIYCGGGYFGEQPRHKLYWSVRNFYRHGIIAILANWFKIPYAIIGVEFGPISYSWFRRIVLWIAKNAKLVVVRNQESFDFLTQHGIEDVKITMDAVLSLSADYALKQKVKCQSNIIILHIPCFYTYPNECMNIVKSIVSYVKNNKNDKYVLEIVSDDPYKPYDHQKCQILKDYLNKEKINYNIPDYQSCEWMIGKINEAKLIFTTKLHVGITSAALNKKCFSFFAHPKTKRLHRQIKNERFCIPLDSTRELIDERITEFFKSSEFVLSEHCKNSAIMNKTYLFNFLDSIYCKG